MKPIVCVFCEGNDTKIVAVEKEKDKIRILKAASFNVVPSAVEVNARHNRFNDWM